MSAHPEVSKGDTALVIIAMFLCLCVVWFSGCKPRGLTAEEELLIIPASVKLGMTLEERIEDAIDWGYTRGKADCMDELEGRETIGSGDVRCDAAVLPRLNKLYQSRRQRRKEGEVLYEEHQDSHRILMKP